MSSARAPGGGRPPVAAPALVRRCGRVLIVGARHRGRGNEEGSMAEVHGSCDDRFSGVREALERRLDEDELGASVAVALAALVLVDRGELDVYAPVADYWPEFSAKGKKDVEVRHLMSHTSGVSGWDQPFSVRDMYDWETACERLALQRPWWEPGTASGYHANNQGFLVGELVRRITNTTFQRFVADEIAAPLGADFQ